MRNATVHEGDQGILQRAGVAIPTNAKFFEE
jgi:hypothetical protein